MLKKLWGKSEVLEISKKEEDLTNQNSHSSLSPYEAYLAQQKAKVAKNEAQNEKIGSSFLDANLEEKALKDSLADQNTDSSLQNYDKKGLNERVRQEQEVPLKAYIGSKVDFIYEENASEGVKKAEDSSWFLRLRSGLSRSSKQLGQNVSAIFTKTRLTEDSLASLEDVLLMADLGLKTSLKIVQSLREKWYDETISEKEVHEIMAKEIERVLVPLAKRLSLDLSKKPHVILFVGVNGSGKTTTIGKLAAKLHSSGLKVMLAAGDTFRAAAIEQLHIWGERIGVPVVSKSLGSDAASLAYEAYQKAIETKQDVLLIDTAGRLQNKTELMEECAKIVRVLKKQDESAPHSILQILDATTGQNALRQVEVFQEFVGVNGLVMTKLDGSSRGGILVAIASKFGLPIYFIGVGEKIDDLEPFEAKDFSRALVQLDKSQ